MKLRTRVFLAWGLLALVLWGGIYWVVQATVSTAFDRRAEVSFLRTREALHAIQQERSERMLEASSLLMQIPELRALIAEHSYELQHEAAVSLQERLDYLVEVVDASFGLALNAQGRLIAAGGRAPFGERDQLHEALHQPGPVRGLVERVFDPDNASTGAQGLWADHRRLYQVVAVPLTFQAAPGQSAPVEGALIIGRCMTDRLARELGQAQAAQISFANTAGQVVASSLDPADRAELMRLLQTTGHDDDEPFTTHLAGESYLTSHHRLVDPITGTVVGSALIQYSLTQSQQTLAALTRNLLLTIAVGLLLGGIASLVLAAAITRPIHRLLTAVRGVAGGNLDQNIETHRHDEIGELATAFNDMVNQIRHRQALERQLVEMETATRTKTEFLASISHEIRTPMTAILGYAELLKNPDHPPADRDDAINVIRRNGTQLLTIINDILDLSKIEAGQMQIERIECCPSQIISDVASLMRLRAAEKDLHFVAELDAPIPRTIVTDPTRVRQILVNLVSNAIKFTASGSVRIGAALNEAGDRLRFRVTDTGVGMTPEQAARIFDPFTQADTSTTRCFGGTGLGLTICRQLAEALGGWIRVDSAPGQGSTFTVEVDPGPVADVPMIHRLDDALRDAGVEAEPPTSRLTGRILLAEDSDDNRRLLAHLLQAAGAEVVAVSNGLLACEQALADDAHFDLILMDMQMPQMDGYTATRRLRVNGYTAPIVALTANTSADDRDKCRHCGCTDYLSKPVPRHVLLEMTARYLSIEAAGADPDPPPDEQLDEAVQAFLGTYVASLPERVTRMLELLRRRDLDELARQLHTLKGSSGLYGFEDISEQAEAAEQALQIGDELDAAAARVEELVDMIRQVRGYDPAHEAPAATQR